jgi:hypothetical protein
MVLGDDVVLPRPGGANLEVSFRVCPGEPSWVCVGQVLVGYLVERQQDRLARRLAGNSECSAHLARSAVRPWLGDKLYTAGSLTRVEFETMPEVSHGPVIIQCVQPRRARVEGVELESPIEP